jgi:hypothetical protein
MLSKELGAKDDIDGSLSCIFLSKVICSRIDAKTEKEKKGLAHHEGRTRSLQIAVMMRRSIRHKSLTLYPIELGGRLRMDQIRLTRH